MFVLMPVMTLVLNLMIVLILYFGAFDVLNSSVLTGDIIAFIQYSTQIVTSFIDGRFFNYSSKNSCFWKACC